MVAYFCKTSSFISTFDRAPNMVEVLARAFSHPQPEQEFGKDNN